MDLHLTCDVRDHVCLFVNGALVAEIAVAQCDTRDTLAQEVHQARALKTLARMVRSLAAMVTKAGDLPDHTATTLAVKMQRHLQGFRDGLEEATIPHPSPGVPPILPHGTPSYRRGYAQGEALVQCLRYAEGKEEEQG
jgi:hypothetical protein